MYYFEYAGKFPGTDQVMDRTLKPGLSLEIWSGLASMPFVICVCYMCEYVREARKTHYTL